MHSSRGCAIKFSVVAGLTAIRHLLPQMSRATEMQKIRRRWTYHEDNELQAMVRRSFSIQKMAKALKRTKPAIRQARVQARYLPPWVLSQRALVPRGIEGSVSGYV